MAKISQKRQREIFEEKETKRKIELIGKTAIAAKQNLRLINRYWDSLENIEDRIEAAKQFPVGFDFDEHNFWTDEALDEKGKVGK